MMTSFSLLPGSIATSSISRQHARQQNGQAMIDIMNSFEIRARSWSV